jgi:hypothetical protein
MIQKEIIEVQRVELETEVPRKEEGDEENELEDDKETDKWDIEAERDQLRNEGRWIREERRGETEEIGNMADAEGGSLSE